MRLKYVSTINPETLTDLPESWETLEYADLAAGSPDTGVLGFREISRDEAPTRARRRARKDDILVSSLVDRKRPQAVYPAPVDAGRLPRVFSTGFFVIRPDDARVEHRFLFYALQSRQTQARLQTVAKGVTMVAFTPDDLGSVEIPLPPLSGQRRVAALLDAETARIDRLIDHKRRLLVLMSARRYSAISEALESTAHEFVPLRRLVASFVDYRGATPEKSASGVPLVTASNVNDGEIDFARGEQFVSSETYDEWMRRGLPEVDDVLLTTEAPLGEVAMVTNPHVALAQRIILLRPDRRRVIPEFLFASLRSPVVQADLLSRASGSTVWGIRSDRLRDVKVHLVDQAEQHRVVTVMREVDSEYRRLRELLNDQISLLRERREALVTAAVSEQLDFANGTA